MWEEIVVVWNVMGGVVGVLLGNCGEVYTHLLFFCEFVKD